METRNTLMKAYIYLFPLVLMDATKTFTTNTAKPDPITGRAPVNQFMHGEKLADASFKQVVSPNVDTIYSTAFVDLKDGPIVLIAPQTDRFFNVQVLDNWTDTVAVIKEGGTYIFVRDENDIEVPEGVQKIVADTDVLWLITRTIIFNKEDMVNVKKIQDGMKLLPWNCFSTGKPYVAPLGSVDEKNNFVPIERVMSMSAAEFFNKGNELLITNPAREADKEYTEGFEELSIGAGLTFVPEKISESIEDDYKECKESFQVTVATKSMEYAKKFGAWLYYGSPIGEFGTAYEYRASIALFGLGANPVYVAAYPKAETDSSGKVFDGNNTYKLHFNSLPPVHDDGFWSVTAYGSDDFLIDNPINRYAINDKSDFKLNNDGSLDVILSYEKPDNETLWLPVSRDKFGLIMRMYLPDTDKLETWQYPEIELV